MFSGASHHDHRYRAKWEEMLKDGTPEKECNKKKIEIEIWTTEFQKNHCWKIRGRKDYSIKRQTKSSEFSKYFTPKP